MQRCSHLLASLVLPMCLLEAVMFLQEGCVKGRGYVSSWLYMGARAGRLLSCCLAVSRQDRRVNRSVLSELASCVQCWSLWTASGVCF